ncbi:MAG: haloacid dehalogenase type II [Acidobacteriia bacterium]|nr:haloacid dehalogenase type II [Terriglobia bacterium]
MALLAFDVYGTLIDPLSMEAALAEYFGKNAAQAAALWRQKQLEYSFRRAAMKAYENFDVCTTQALDYTCRSFGVTLDHDALLAQYRRLPAYPGTGAALARIAARGDRLAAFSNGTEKSVRALLEHAGLLGRFEAIVSVDEARSFKPDPAVYEFLARRLSSREIWMVSSNPFDVIGAKSAGLRAVWLRRDANAVFDPWGLSADATVAGLEELAEAELG